MYVLLFYYIIVIVMIVAMAEDIVAEEVGIETIEEETESETETIGIAIAVEREEAGTGRNILAEIVIVMSAVVVEEEVQEVDLAPDLLVWREKEKERGTEEIVVENVSVLVQGE